MMPKKQNFIFLQLNELAGFAQLVNGGKTMKGQTFYLDKDIVLNDISDYEQME